MDPAVDVNNAITSYSDWSHPWSFDNHVKTRLAHRESSQALFQDVWREALGYSHWQSGDLAACAKAAASAVRAQFPTISEAAADAIANAAAYEWR